MIKKRLFDYHPCGIPVYAYDISCVDGFSATVINYGATLQRLLVTDKFGVKRDVVGGFDRIIDYMDSDNNQGGIIGRVCNRIKNAEYYVDGVKYHTYANDGNHTLHGGRFGFNKKLWKAEYDDEESDYLTFSYLSPDGEEGFPGNLKVRVLYKISANSLEINYNASADRKTIINLTNHSYFNLNGYDSGDIYKQAVRIKSSRINETDAELIPTGRFMCVSGTPCDLNESKLLHDVLASNYPIINDLCGLDTNYIFDDYDGSIKHQANFYSEESGILMNIYTNQSSVQIYTANSVKPTEPFMKGGVKTRKHFGVCFETGSMPDAINHAGFDDITLCPGQIYNQTTIFEFSHK